jgi:hypothetical protein
MTMTASNSDRHSPTQPGAQPSAPSVDADVLMSRWRAATAHPLGVFWPRQGRWHGGTGLTTSPGAGGSSNTLQGLHPC